MKRHVLRPEVGDILQWKDPQGTNNIVIVLVVHADRFFFINEHNDPSGNGLGWGWNPFIETFYYPVEAKDRE